GLGQAASEDAKPAFATKPDDSRFRPRLRLNPKAAALLDRDRLFQGLRPGLEVNHALATAHPRGGLASTGLGSPESAGLPTTPRSDASPRATLVAALAARAAAAGAFVCSRSRGSLTAGFRTISAIVCCPLDPEPMSALLEVSAFCRGESAGAGSRCHRAIPDCCPASPDYTRALAASALGPGA